ncbi:MAG: DUF3343 domain-containing protein [Gorillibacterium sp.]|nr:DUF3343 domain-containing protein [Gorillibacterium sp.]
MLLIAFDSTQQALRMEMLLDYLDIESDPQPTPKVITAGCAISIAFEETDLSAVVRIVQEEKVEIRGVFRKNGLDYEEIFIADKLID